MRLAYRFALALTLALVLVLAGNAWYRVRREMRLFESDSQRDHRVLGSALASAVEHVRAAYGEEEARRLVAGLGVGLDGSASDVEVRWVPLHEIDAARLAEFEARGMSIRRHSPVGRPRVVTSLYPLHGAGSLVGGLELSETRRGERAYMRASVVQVAVVTLVSVVLCAAFALFLGRMFVGRPIHALVRMARRIGAGDLSARAAVTQRDEIGELALEMSRMADALAQARRRLEEETAARLGALDQLRHADRLATVGKLAAGIAHELGTPLNVVTGRARLVAAEPQAPDVAEHARIIGQQASGMARIIRQLLDFARRRPPRMSEDDLGRIARATVELLRPLAEKQQVTLEVAAAEAVRAPVDAVQLQQALTNLVVNAVQAMTGPGAVRIEVSRGVQAPPADVGGPEREWARVAVRDSGSGIAPEVLPRVFEPFFTTKGVGEGTGLGLSVAWGIVREHGGWISVESEPGAGSTFTLHVPAGE